MKRIRKIVYPITIVLFIFIIACIVIVKKNLNNNKYNDIEIVNDIVKEENEMLEEESSIYNIDIKGAVNYPGVYQLDSTLTVNDAINIACT